MMDDLSGGNIVIEALQHSFDPPFTESSANSQPSRSLRPQTLHKADNLSLERSSRPSVIENPSSEKLTQSMNIDDKTVFGIVHPVQQEGLDQREKRKLIKPYNLEESVHYLSFLPEQSLNMEIAGLDPILQDKDGIVRLKGVPHKILKSNGELVPLCIDSPDP